ncbi:hypothetical protein HZP25_18520 [Elizabethkingia anophelis]|nr:hypothetical protein [Elizabethkingia anophelis]
MENNNKDTPVIKIINHATDIFPTAPLQFCMGVNNYLSGNYDENYLFLENAYFKMGYNQAKSDELDKYYVLASKVNNQRG